MSTQIDAIEQWVGAQLPLDYRNLLAQHEESYFANDLVLIYGRNDFVERNETYEVKEYCQGHVTIGDDSGGRQILLSLRSGQVLLADAGWLEPADALTVAESVSKWLAAGCPAPDDE